MASSRNVGLWMGVHCAALLSEPEASAKRVRSSLTLQARMATVI
jgi:hypothetical protein